MMDEKYKLTPEMIRKLEEASDAVDKYIEEYEKPEELKDDILKIPMQF